MRARPTWILTLLMFGTMLVVGVLTGSSEARPIDRGGLGKGRYATMEALLEKTVLQVDVLHAHMHFDQKTANAIGEAARGRKLTDEVEQRIAMRAFRAENAFVEIRFLRDIDLDDFIEGIRENLQRAYEAGMITEENYERVSANLPRWFSFLEERGIVEGDRLLYRVRPKSLRTVYLDDRGKTRLDQVDEGPAPRLALLGGYFAPGTDLRRPLIASLFDED